MSADSTINLLWADDDSTQLLEPLGRRLERNGFRLVKATNYTDALDLLNVKGQADALLADIILPHSSGRGVLGYDLGLELADRASEQGIWAVAFLTVVPLDEVIDKFERLKRKYPRVRFTYFDKIFLLEPNTIEVLSEALKPQSDY
jgi:CheY-like chemotaxis protein